MAKYFLCFTLFIVLLHAQSKDLDKKIRNQKSSLAKQKSAQQITATKIKTMAKQINTQNSELKKLEKEIEIINADIFENKKRLANSENELTLLNISSKELIRKKIDAEDQLIELIIQDYSATQAIKLANENSLEELMNSEVYEVISNHTKDEILKINNQYMKVVQNKASNEKNVKQLSSYIKKREKKKKILDFLKSKHSKSLKSLESKHKAYQKELKRIIAKQRSMSDLLGKLNILKKAELKKEKAQKKKEQQRLAALKKKRQKAASKQSNTTSQSQIQARNAEKIDLDVRMLGSSTKGVKISRYRGSKTISPLKKYTILKKFGKYFDPVYKIQLFNESVVLKSKQRKAKVYSVLNGKVVYAKQNSGILENVVIVQHKNGLHTIYSHLDQISPTLRVGKWIKKGYVVGRVNETLTFQATKNNSHINPEELFR